MSGLPKPLLHTFISSSIKVHSEHGENFKYHDQKIIIRKLHCMRSVQIRSCSWSVFSCIRTEYRPEITPYLDTFQVQLNYWIWFLSFTRKNEHTFERADLIISKYCLHILQFFSNISADDSKNFNEEWTKSIIQWMNWLINA